MKAIITTTTRSSKTSTHKRHKTTKSQKKEIVITADFFISIMDLAVVSHDDLSVFFSNSVVFSRIGNSGEEQYYPGTMTIFSIKSRDFKGQIVARNYAGNVLIFNGMIPGNVPVIPFPDELVIRFGKVPSLSYVNEAGKPIPTLWKIKFSLADDFKKCFSLMLLFSHHGHVVNRLADVEKKTVANKKNSLANKKQSSKANASKKIAADEKNKKKKIIQPTINFYDNDDDDDDGSFSTPKKVPMPKKIGKNTSYDSSVDLLGNSDDDYEKENNKKNNNKKTILDDSIFSNDSSYDFGSPVFAQSQDIYTSLGRKNPNNRDSIECFSPLMSSDDETNF